MFVDDFVQNVALIGDTASGKTCFIAALRWLGETGTFPLTNIGANGETKKYLDLLFEDLNAGRVIAGTQRSTSLDFSEVFGEGRERTVLNFKLVDFRGQDIKEVDRDSELFKTWASSDVLLVLLDAGLVQRSDAQMRENLHAICEQLSRPEMNVAQKRLAILVTQADKVTDRENCSPEVARAFMDEYLKDFSDQISRMGYRDWRCFFISSLGVEPERDVNGFKLLCKDEQGRRVPQSFGYEHLLFWVAEEKRRAIVERTRNAVLKWVGLPVLSGLFLWGGIYMCVAHRQARAKTHYYSPNATWEEKAAATWQMKESDCVDAMEDAIDKYNQKLSSEDLANVRETLFVTAQFFGKAKISIPQNIRLSEIRKTAVHRIEDDLVSNIQGAIDDEQRKRLIDDYDKDALIEKYRKDEVQAERLALKDRLQFKQKGGIWVCDPGRPGEDGKMRAKLEKIRNYDYGNPDDKKEALFAVNDMERLLRGSFTVKDIKVGDLRYVYETQVKIAIGVAAGHDLKDECCLETSWNKQQSWDVNHIERNMLHLAPGQSVRVEWRRNPRWWPNYFIAWWESKDDWLTALMLMQPHSQLSGNNKVDFWGNPWITIECEEFPNPKQSLDLIKKYVLPGTYWEE